MQAVFLTKSCFVNPGKGNPGFEFSAMIVVAYVVAFSLV
jgi:hypothetical protein